jgi:hypothetical protein
MSDGMTGTRHDADAAVPPSIRHHNIAKRTTGREVPTGSIDWFAPRRNWVHGNVARSGEKP